MISEKWDLYKHRNLHKGNEWEYAAWIESYRGPYNSLRELAESLPLLNPHSVEFVSQRPRNIVSGTQISPLSEDELAEVYSYLLNRNSRKTVQRVTA